MSYKKFLYLFIGTLVCFIVFFYTILKYLSFLYENNTYEEIVKRQMKNNSIYGSALNENYYSYRLQMIREKKPEIVIIGTSRAGLFRQIYFDKSMIAATNSSNRPSEMEAFIQQMLTFHIPKIVFLNLDPWWLLKSFPNYKNASYQELTGKDITQEKIKNIFKYLLIGKIPLSTKFLKENFISNPYSNYDSLGLRAINNSDGSFSDGSTFYASTIYGLGNFADIKFENTFYRLQQQMFPFYYAQTIESDRIKQLEHIQQILKDHNIHVITYIAPIAPTIYKTIQNQYKDQYSYLNAIDSYAKEKNIYNFFNPSTLNTTDCEFYDGFHGGDIAYARMLLKISQKDSFLKGYINTKKLQEIINTKQGRAFALEHKKGMKEIDFLQIGCQKE